ncbi:hypothetical protein B0H14DRAFT_3131107 [Mycena olivaceomarginata]|nr:hypothetical protein B0H14DRAFT_3131107 [Mycena olivaceomarginata]
MSTREPRNSADLDARVRKSSRVPHTTQDDPALAFVATHKLLGSPIQVQPHDSARRVGKWDGKRRLAHRTSIALDRPLSPPSPTDDPLLLVSFPPEERYPYEPTTAVPGDIWPSTHVELANSDPALEVPRPSTWTALPVTKDTDIMQVPTKSDPPTPDSRERRAAWGVWGSPWPGRGPEGREGSFRMDGRRLFAAELERSTDQTAPAARDNTEDVESYTENDLHLFTYMAYDARFDFNFHS